MIEPKFKVGDKVFVADAWKKDIQVQCPDCRGKLVWKVECPSGQAFTIPCYTCQKGYEGCFGTITKWQPSPSIVKRTIGSVRIDTNDKHPVSYMCKETGVGSGSVYNEENVFSNEIDALKYATKKAVEICDQENARKRKIQEYEKKQARRNPLRN